MTVYRHNGREITREEFLALPSKPGAPRFHVGPTVYVESRALPRWWKGAKEWSKDGKPRVAGRRGMDDARAFARDHGDELCEARGMDED